MAADEAPSIRSSPFAGDVPDLIHVVLEGKVIARERAMNGNAVIFAIAGDS